MAGALDPDDGVAAHVEDTLRVGDGLCQPRDRRDLRARGARAHPVAGRRAWRPVRSRRRRPPRAGTRGGHTARRIVHAKDSTGLGDPGGAAGGRRQARRAHHAAARSPGDRSADHRQVRRSERRVRRLPPRPADREGRDGHRARGRAGHRRLGQGLPLHVQPRRGDRRRRGDGLPGRRAHRQHGVLSISPDGAVPPGGQVVPHQRSAARRRGDPAAARRHGVHAALSRDEGSRRRATSSRAPSTPR